MAVKTDSASAPKLAALSDTDIYCDSLDKSKFLVIGAILFNAKCALLHPTTVVKTRMQLASSGLSQVKGFSVFSHILKNDGIHGIFHWFGTSAIGSLSGRVLVLTSLEVSKDMTLKYLDIYDEMSVATHLGIANGVVDKVCQRLMVQGVPKTMVCNGANDVIRKVMKLEGLRGLYRGFGLTAVTQTQASTLWWGTYGSVQHVIWRVWEIVMIRRRSRLMFR